VTGQQMVKLGEHERGEQQRRRGFGQRRCTLGVIALAGRRSPRATRSYRAGSRSAEAGEHLIVRLASRGNRRSSAPLVQSEESRRRRGDGDQDGGEMARAATRGRKTGKGNAHDRPRILASSTDSSKKRW
jgi:hypothetical protein